MDRKIPRICFVIALILASTFLLVPASNAETRETPRMAAMKAGPDWLGSALTWLNDVLRARVDRAREQRMPVSAVTKAEVGDSNYAGICIDPMGRPRPCPNG